MTNNELFKKYLPVTKLIDEWREQNNDKVYDVRYKFVSDNEVDVIYTVIFEYKIENNSIPDILMNELSTKINDNFHNKINIILTHRFRNRCKDCEKRRQEKDGESYRQNNADKI